MDSSFRNLADVEKQVQSQESQSTSSYHLDARGFVQPLDEEQRKVVRKESSEEKVEPMATSFDDKWLGLVDISAKSND